MKKVSHNLIDERPSLLVTTPPSLVLMSFVEVKIKRFKFNTLNHDHVIMGPPTAGLEIAFHLLPFTLIIF